MRLRQLQQANDTVRQMSRLSRNFVAANNLCKLAQRLELKQKWQGFGAIVRGSNDAKSQSTTQHQALINDLKDKNAYLERQVQARDSDLAKMEQMFKEYASWR